MVQNRKFEENQKFWNFFCKNEYVSVFYCVLDINIMCDAVEYFLKNQNILRLLGFDQTNFLKFDDFIGDRLRDAKI